MKRGKKIGDGWMVVVACMQAQLSVLESDSPVLPRHLAGVVSLSLHYQSKKRSEETVQLWSVVQHE